MLKLLKGEKMKKLKYLFFIILLIIFIMPIANAKKVATCTYSIPFEVYDGFRKTKTVNVNFTITVNDDGSLEYNPPQNMDIVPDEASEEGHRWFYDLKKFSKNVYDNNKVSSECPKLISYMDNNDIYNIHVTDSNTASDLDLTGSYINIHKLNGELKAESGTKVDNKKEETICERQSKIEFETNTTLKVRFFVDSNGRKKFEVTNMTSGISGDAFADDGYVSLKMPTNNWVFYMDTENMEKFYKSKSSCENADLYWDMPDGKLSQNVYITNKEPKKENNAGLNKDGKDYVEQGSWDPDKLCDNGDCNIDITKFCNDPYVARTLKFLGLLLAIAKVIVPALIIGLGFVDLAKIVMSGKVDEAKKQGINIIKRVVIGIVIFIIPTILITIYNVAYSIANDSEEVPEGELNVPTNFKNCVGCILDANNKDACIVNTN